MAFIYNLTDTWNSGATTFAGIKMAVTNTASGASSKLLDLTVSGSTTGSFSVDRSGNGALSGALTLGSPLGVASGGTGVASLTAGYIPFGNGTSAFGSSANLSWDSANSRLWVGGIISTTLFVGMVVRNGGIANINAYGGYYALQASGGTGYRWTLSNDSTFRLQYTTDGFSSVSSTPLMVDATGKILINTTVSGASKLTVADDSIQINTAKTPASATATGTTGQVCWDSSYIYVCTATNTWKRAALATW